MYQLTQLAAAQHRQRLAEAQRPAGRALALARATRRAERAERRMRFMVSSLISMRLG